MPGHNHPPDCPCGWCYKEPKAANKPLPFRDSFSYVNPKVWNKPSLSRDTFSYVDPNAICPVCGAHVFYFENSSGSRVFFDALGWPWDKHPCTDNERGSSSKVRMLSYSLDHSDPPKPRDKNGKILDLYEIVSWRENDGKIEIKFRKISGNGTFGIHCKKRQLEKYDIKKSGFVEAPSFVVKTLNHNQRQIDFISVRTAKIIRLKVPRGGVDTLTK